MKKATNEASWTKTTPKEEIINLLWQALAYGGGGTVP